MQYKTNKTKAKGNPAIIRRRSQEVSERPRASTGQTACLENAGSPGQVCSPESVEPPRSENRVFLYKSWKPVLCLCFCFWGTQESLKSPQGAPNQSARPSKKPPGRHKSHQEVARNPPEVARSPQGAPRSPQGAPEEVPRSPKQPQGASKESQGDPETLKELPI